MGAGGVFAGGFGLVLIIVGLIIAVLWLVLPFAIFGIAGVTARGRVRQDGASGVRCSLVAAWLATARTPHRIDDTPHATFQKLQKSPAPGRYGAHSGGTAQLGAA
jgi:hypothetical protein